MSSRRVQTCAALVCALVLLSHCAPVLTEAGSKVQVIPGHAIGGEPPPAGCEVLSSIEWAGYRSWRLNMNFMRSRAAELGATHIRILEQPPSAESIVALAYRCRPPASPPPASPPASAPPAVVAPVAVASSPAARGEPSPNSRR